MVTHFGFCLANPYLIFVCFSTAGHTQHIDRALLDGVGADEVPGRAPYTAGSREVIP